MQKNTLMFVLVGVVLVVGGYFFMTKNGQPDNATAQVVPVAQDALPVTMTPSVSETAVTEAPVASTEVSKVKEFSMTAYYDAAGKWFSLKEMSVKKGDTVRVNITNTKGMHNFTIDELGIAQKLPLNEKVVVEFTASKVGDFVYYCSMPSHRSGGQWGTLHITE